MPAALFSDTFPLLPLYFRRDEMPEAASYMP